MNKYPIYIPSKGRWDKTLTANMFDKENVFYFVVIVEDEKEKYQERFESKNLLILPPENTGWLSGSRNWIKNHATESGFKFHWQFDDDIRKIKKIDKKKTVKCSTLEALQEIENLVDQYQNIGISGIRNACFPDFKKSLKINQMAYCCVLVNNKNQFEWRGGKGIEDWQHEDTDYSIQVLSMGLCTVLINYYVFESANIGTNAGGCFEKYTFDKRINGIRKLQKKWPNLGIDITMRNGVPRPKTAHLWRKFKTPLKKHE